MNKENYFIHQVATNKFIGDDGAVVLEKLKKNQHYVYSMDAFFEDVHFKKEWFTLEQIAVKAMLVNISDAIVMNAYPKYALLSVAIPSYYTQSDLDQLAVGFKKIAKKFGITIIGGDTIANIKLDISITIISVTSDPVYRTGTKAGDLICYTGELGTTKEDLEKLFNNQSIDPKSRFIKPRLRGEFFYEVAPLIHSALDISDGLFFELQRLSKANKIGFDFFEGIPQAMGCSGEEYEILFSFDPKNRKKIEKIAYKYSVPLNLIAQAIDGSYECKCKEHHF